MVEKKQASAESLAQVDATRNKNGSYSSGGIGRFKSAELAARVMDTRKKLQAHVNIAGTDPIARQTALLAFFRKQ